MIRTRLPLALASLVTASLANAQDFNVDCSANGQATPADTYGGAAAQPGFWNLVQDTGQLADLAGNVLPVFLTVPAGGNFTGGDPCAAGDDAALLNDFRDPGTGFFRFSGLIPGDYLVYTYAMATDDPTFRTDVSVQGSPDPLTTVGGDFCGGFVQGVTHAVHSVTTTNGRIFVDVAVNTGFSTVNGFQLVCTSCPGDTTGTALCFGDGSGTPCPCGNAGGADEGCANSTGAGASLTATGTATIAGDDVVLTATNAIPNQPGLFFQGNNATGGGAGLFFGDGLRCCGGGVVRLQIVVPNASGAASTSVGVAAQGGVAPGDTRCYQFWYRNPSGSPCGSGFNLTNGYQITWS